MDAMANPKTSTGRSDRLPVKSVIIKMNEAGWDALKLLAHKRRTTLNAVMIEAANALLKKHGEQPVVSNPLLGSDKD